MRNQTGKMEGPSSLNQKFIAESCRCNKCGFCQSVCPVYGVLKLESYSPRAKVRLTREICNHQLSISPRMRDIFSTCILCAACYNVCPAQVHGDHLFSGMRWRIAEHYGPDWKKKLLYMLLSRPWQLSASAQMARWAQTVFGPLLAVMPPGDIPIDRLPALNRKPFNRQVQRVVSAIGTTRTKVLYFHGCATNYLFEQTGFAVVDVLTHMGVEVHVPQNQGCCGLPIFLSGARKMSLQCIRNTVQSFSQEPFDAIIVDCATCGTTFKNEYTRILHEMQSGSADIPAELLTAAQKLAGKTYDIVEYIAIHQDWLPQMAAHPEIVRVTYHDPCHLLKGQGIGDEPRQVLQHLPGIKFVEAPKAADCCGGGGVFQVDYPQISKVITEQKILDIKNTKADIMATGCPACLLTIGMHLDPSGGIEPVHTVELVQKAIAPQKKV